MTLNAYLKTLIQSDNGESAKSFFLISVTIMGLFLLFICGVVLIIDVIKNGHVLSDFYGMATFVAAVASLFGAVGWTKIAGEKRYYEYRKSENDKEIAKSQAKPSKDDIEKALSC